VPFVAVSYGAGLTAVRLAPYALSTALGLVPSTLVQVGVGASAGVLADRATTSVIAAGLGAVLVLAGLAVLVRRRRRPAPGAEPV
jgi:uncharacterized protein (TIGR03382 family)